MSDIERARRQLQISGYVHPENTNTSKSKRYKIFDSQNKEKKSYMSSLNFDHYATFSEKKSQQNLLMICPVCGGQAMYECSCKYKDKQCSKGHIWYINLNGKIAKGDPHE